MKYRLPFCITIALHLLLAGNAYAEKADSEKQIEISAIKSEDDDIKQIKTFTGNVVLIQGTLILKGTKLVVTTSSDGWEFATLYAPAGGLATMRQKRDGGPDLWMEGEASDKITYDQKTSVSKLFSNAKVRRLTGKPDGPPAKVKTAPSEADAGTASAAPKGEMREWAIRFAPGPDFMLTGANNESGESKPGEGRVKVKIQPHNHPEAKDNK